MSDIKVSASIVDESIPAPEYQYDEEKVELHEAIKKVIETQPGMPLVNVLGSVSLWYQDNLEKVSPDYSKVFEALAKLSESGEITRLESRSGNGIDRETTYYPREYRFEVTPRGLAINPIPKPKLLEQPLSPADIKVYESIKTLMEISSSRIVVRLLNNFCCRCGSSGSQEEHFCNE